eukprot:CAMPEP_0182464300 /NCGR_PEP_ID=MMETSP1319-20130603/8497_1 /TAXON_ID=172717 /ORGANISM="Bolidomonas pacifica, Strain RCC208" /LENGTH=76 /DNA_ID=CAMNT_0024663939 /DNA_START=19 /DNA_END=249 /DNA_ORIENTATION=-
MAPAVIVTGSLVFAVLVGALLLLTGAARGAGVLDKDNTAIASIIITISGVCMWMFWVCSCLHQWHPLIQPLYEKME